MTVGGGRAPWVSSLPATTPGLRSKCSGAEAWRSGENHPSLRATAVNSCVAVSRGRSSMKGCGFSFYFIVYISISMGFLPSIVQSMPHRPTVAAHVAL